MIRRGRCILVAKADGWHMIQPDAPECFVAPLDAPESEVANRCVESVTDAKKSEVFLLLAAEEFLHHSFQLADVAGSRRRQPLIYRLEADLPLNAEEIVADFRFESTQDSPRVSAIAADIRRIAPLAERLNEAGFSVKTITARSLILAQWLLANGKLVNPCLLLLNYPAEETAAELLAFENGLLVDWRLLQDRPSITSSLRMLLSGRKQSTLYVAGIDPNGIDPNGIDPNGIDPNGIDPNGIDPNDGDLSPGESQTDDSSQSSPGTIAGFAYTLLPTDIHQAQLDAERRLLSGRLRPDFDLVRDPGLVAGRWIDNAQRRNRLVTTVALCTLMISAACLWRSERLAAAVEDLRQKQASIFRETFPDQKVPTAVHSRLQSEYTKLIDSKTLEEGSVTMPLPAIPAIHRLLESMPDAPPLGIDELRVSDGEIYLDLVLQEHSQAADLAEKLRNSGFAIAPPTTESAGGKVRALLRGGLRGDLP